MGDTKIFDRIKDSIIFDMRHLDLDIIHIYFKFLLDKLGNTIFRKPDLSSEEFFWKRHYRQYYIETGNAPYKGRIEDTKESICLSINHLFNIFSKPLFCLDVGCGPTSQFYTKKLQNKQEDLCVISVDPLADVYTYLHKRYNTGYDIDCIEGYGEKLGDLFPKEKFHLIYSQNALDHSQDPEKFLLAAYDVLKPNGLLVLHGFMNEGTAAHWLGLHQWDIIERDNDLLLSNKNKTIVEKNITKKFKMDLLFKNVSGWEVGDTYTIIYSK